MKLQQMYECLWAVTIDVGTSLCRTSLSVETAQLIREHRRLTRYFLLSRGHGPWLGMSIQQSRFSRSRIIVYSRSYGTDDGNVLYP